MLRGLSQAMLTISACRLQLRVEQYRRDLPLAARKSGRRPLTSDFARLMHWGQPHERRRRASIRARRPVTPSTEADRCKLLS
jgi:hypothetical protein